MDGESQDYGYEPFAQTAEYREVNEAIVRNWVTKIREAGSRSVEQVLDLATGVGTMIELLLDTLPARARPIEIVCVDMNADALEQAAKNLKRRVQNLRLVRARLQDLSLEDECVDAAIWGNGVHYLSAEEQSAACRNIRRTVRKKGWLFLNTAFYEEARPASTLAFYRSQIARAVRDLRSRGISRDRNQPHPDSANFLPLTHYRNLLQQAGFEVEEMVQIEARLHQAALQKISGFSQYAAGALHGYPPKAAAEAMRETVAPCLEEYGLRDEHGVPYIPRNWLSAIARVS